MQTRWQAGPVRLPSKLNRAHRKSPYSLQRSVVICIVMFCLLVCTFRACTLSKMQVFSPAQRSQYVLYTRLSIFGCIAPMGKPTSNRPPPTGRSAGLLNLVIILLLAGDVEQNPGPLSLEIMIPSSQLTRAGAFMLHLQQAGFPQLLAGIAPWPIVLLSQPLQQQPLWPLQFPPQSLQLSWQLWQQEWFIRSQLTQPLYQIQWLLRSPLLMPLTQPALCTFTCCRAVRRD